MIRACVVAAGAVAVLGAAPDAGAQNPPQELRIGLARPMFKDVPEAMVTAGAKPFQTMIQDKAGIKGVVEVVPDYRALADGVKNGKLDICVFHGFEYAWVKDTPGLVPLVSTVTNCGKVQACLVVGADSKAAGPKDLKGACVVVPPGSKAHCHMFLDHLRRAVPAGDCAPAKAAAGLSFQDALADVANGSAEAAVVDVSALIALKNNFPACHKRLRILAESELLPSAVVVYRQGAINPATAARVRKGLLDCVNTPIGKTFALFWQLKGFADVSSEYNALVEKSLKAYPPPAVPASPPAPAPK